MAKQVVWSLKAAKERYQILDYWFKKTGNIKYSRKLNIKFNETIRNIKDNNYIGKQTNYKNIRVSVISHYLLFYRIMTENIEIVTLFDSRQDPQKLKLE